MEWYGYPIVAIVYLIWFFLLGLGLFSIMMLFGMIYNATEEWDLKKWQIVLLMLVIGAIGHGFAISLGYDPL